MQTIIRVSYFIILIFFAYIIPIILVIRYFNKLWFKKIWAVLCYIPMGSWYVFINEIRYKKAKENQELINIVDPEIKKIEKIRKERYEILIAISASIPAICLFFLIIFQSVISMINNSDIVKETLLELNNNQSVDELLGSPINNDGLLGGTINESGSLQGSAEIQLSVKGTKNKALLEVKAVKDFGKWKYNAFVLLDEKYNVLYDLLK